MFGGVEHGDMVLAPYGGSLFDPDRYPFLEGRQPDTSWTTDAADPLPIDNRTVLHLLNALQTLDEGGQRRKLSFRALDVEQIGHVYEGMLDHTAARAVGWVLGLSGTGGREPEIELSRLESLDGKALVEFLKEQTGRTPATLKNWISDDEADKAVTKFGITWAASFTDDDSEAHARRFAKLIRTDSTGAPTVFQPGSVYVADSSHRGATGTHYTPRSLTQEIVKHTLDPLVYIGPADGTPAEEWELRTPEEILNLKICDPACGSGAFLVQACRYLADAVVEAKRTHERHSDPITADEIIDARRQVVERCLHGVDINPMACEMAKLSLWLITLAHDRPFTFLDHAIRNGDSLLGLWSFQQLINLHVDPVAGRSLQESSLFGSAGELRQKISMAGDLVAELVAVPSRSLGDVEDKQRKLDAALASMSTLKTIANAVVDGAFELGLGRAYDNKSTALAERTEGHREVDRSERDPLHWPLEFPGVFGVGEGRFDALVSNPPFLTGSEITRRYGKAYRVYLRDVVGQGVRGRRGQADLAAFFLRHMGRLANSMGVVATSTVIETDSRSTGLDQLLACGFEIYRASSTAPWPGAASVSVVKIWCSRSHFTQIFFDGAMTATISASLKSGGSGAGHIRAERVERLMRGSSLGKGFLVSKAEEVNLWTAGCGDVIRQMITGKDLCSHPRVLPSRLVLFFGNLGYEAASKYKLAFSLTEQRVTPNRSAKDLEGARPHWRYHTLRPEIYERAAVADGWVIAFPRVSKYLAPHRVPSNLVYSETTMVLPESDWAEYGVLLSTVHLIWSRWTSAPMAGSDRTQYSNVTYETLPPLLTARSEIAMAAMEFDSARSTLLQEFDIGTTKLYDMMHSPGSKRPDVAELIEFMNVLDRKVLLGLGLAAHFENSPEGFDEVVILSPCNAGELVRRICNMEGQ